MRNFEEPCPLVVQFRKPNASCPLYHRHQQHTRPRNKCTNASGHLPLLTQALQATAVAAVGQHQGTMTTRGSRCIVSRAISKFFFLFLFTNYCCLQTLRFIWRVLIWLIGHRHILLWLGRYRLWCCSGLCMAPSE